MNGQKRPLGEMKSYVHICVCVCVHTRAQSLQSFLTLCNAMDRTSPGSSVHGDCPDKNTEVGCSALLQEIFPTQGSNPRLLSPA